MFTRIFLNQMDMKQITDNSCSTSVSERPVNDSVLDPINSRVLIPSNFKNKIWKMNAKFKFEVNIVEMIVRNQTN